LLEINDLEGKFFALCPPLCPYFSPNPKYGHNPERLLDCVQSPGKPGGSYATPKALPCRAGTPRPLFRITPSGNPFHINLDKKIGREQLSTGADIRSKRTALSAPGRKEGAELRARSGSPRCPDPGAVPRD